MNSKCSRLVTRYLLLTITLLASTWVSIAQTPAVESKPETSEKVLGEVDKWIKENDGKEPLYGACVIADCLPEETDKKIEGGRVLTLPKPTYPQLARMAKASGTVKVQVIIDETGQVIAAQAIDGHPLLFGVTVNAAKEARFAPPKRDGQPVKVIGVIQYDFVAP